MQLHSISRRDVPILDCAEKLTRFRCVVYVDMDQLAFWFSVANFDESQYDAHASECSLSFFGEVVSKLSGTDPEIDALQILGNP